MRDTNLPELGFHLGSGVTAGEEGWRNLRGKKKKSGDWEFPAAIYLFTNRVTLCTPQECLAPCPIVLFQTVTRACSSFVTILGMVR